MTCHVKGKLAKQILRAQWQCPHCGGFDAGGRELYCSGCGRKGTITAPRKPRSKRGAKVAKVSPSVFQAACVEHGLPEPVPECRFCLDRRWRFDFGWPNYRGVGGVALEVDGGTWLKGGGRHNRGAGFIADMEKLNRAVVLGWKVVRCTPQDVKSGKVFELLKEVLS